MNRNKEDETNINLEGVPKMLVEQLEIAKNELHRIIGDPLGEILIKRHLQKQIDDLKNGMFDNWNNL